MFCTAKGFEELGIGKVVEVGDKNWLVEYFDSPAQTTRQIQSILKVRITPKILGANTRIYFFDQGSEQWLVGRVLQDMEDGVEIRFADKHDQFLNYEQLYVRCNKQIEDPVDYLANVITETPQYAESRSGFLASYIRQRGSSWGISALLSSTIYLESHQINVIRKVLSDPSQRYLLADEVGLGKTIEAGVVIRQAVLDDPKNHRVVVIVPRVLVAQWRHELTKRFGLRDFVDTSVVVVAHESLEAIDANLTGATLLVIDEAHHIASGSDNVSRIRYDIVRKHSRNIERLLLLSATPVLRNETGFLRMLHLLDPVIYDLKDEKGFRAKISHRQILAEVVASLDPQNVLYLESAVDELVEKLPNDERLLELSNKLKAKLVGLPDEDDPDLVEAIRMLRAHLSETYRLNRRILRNRRKQVTGLTPNRVGARIVTIAESQFERIESLIEAWRISATSFNDHDHDQGENVRLRRSDFYWRLICALVAEPGEIRVICNEWANELLKLPSLLFEGEISLLEEIKNSADYELWLSSRISALINELKKLLVGKCKIVIFCTQSIVANEVFVRLGKVFGDLVVRHEVVDDEDAEDEEQPWTRFNSKSEVRILVCDRSAEEGINLQGGEKIVVHFDLPIDPNRIEQRMGRVDRYGSGSPVVSLAILDSRGKYSNSWYALLNEGLGVFDRSISSLQYLVEDMLQELRASLFLEGVEAIHALNEKLSGPEGAVSKELKLIDQQDGLDELSQPPESEIEEIFDVDDEWKDIQQTTVHWAVNTLMFEQEVEPGLGLDRPLDPPFRFQYRVPGKGGHATLIPLRCFIDDFLGALDYENRRSTSRQPLSYAHCAKRQSALKSGVRLLRYGDEFVEALKSFSDLDDRGRSYAMWRQVNQGLSESAIGMYFRFDFLIETCLDSALSILTDDRGMLADSARSAIARRGDALFPPVVEQVWIDEEGEEPPEEFIATYLASSYDKSGNNGAYVDTNLKSLRFRALMERSPDTFMNWGERCVRMRNRANAIIIDRPSLKDAKVVAISRARSEDEVREAQLATRIRVLSGAEADSERRQLALEMKLNAALYQGIEVPRIKVDVAGVVILSTLPFQHTH